MARILAIDDNSDLLRMIGGLLRERGGHEVILSADGEDGLAKAAADPPDLAIVDVMMPGITGYDVCRRLRQQPATAEIPVIILTARGQEVDRQAAMEAGADIYLAKPLTMAELLEQVNRLLAGRPERPAMHGAGTIAMLSLRGGVGVTTLAVNLALILARQGDGGTCLVDLSPSSGSAALQLGLRPDPNWSTLSALGTPPSPVAVDTCVLGHASGLRLLPAPFTPVVGAGLRREAVLGMLTSLKDKYCTVVVDLPSVLNESTMATLESASAIGLVMTSDPPSIQAVLGTLQALRDLVPRVHIILNHTAPGEQAPVQALERVLRQRLSEVIPFDPAQPRALSKGQPLAASAPDSPLAHSVALLSTRLQPSPLRPVAE